MTKTWYKSFVTKIQFYCLLDTTGDIRATAYDIEGIILAKVNYGWGTIHKMKFDGKILKIGKEIK